MAPGGNHADGLTSNKLVLFEDGVYLEFIAFFENIDPERRKRHRWGCLKENTIIDWAFTFPPRGDFSAIRQRVLNSNTGFIYEEPAAWGREKADGTMLEWTLSAPVDPLGNPVTGYLPFWCLDKTPRQLRVPYNIEHHLTDHPSRVRGVSSLSVSIPHQQASDLIRVYGAMYDSSDLVHWPYEVPSGDARRSHDVFLLRGADTAIKLTLSGSERAEIEVLPGLVLNIE